MNTRFIAVDWSGAVAKPEQKIWLAEVSSAGDVLRLESGRNRTAVIDHLVELASKSPDLVVGLDFAFSLPSWYFTSHNIPDAPTLWDLARAEGERWLADCDPPFWGRPGRKRPETAEHLRRTEKTIPSTGGINPKSVFQVGGAGAVGTGSIRGMPFLSTLRNGGYSIWPFDEPKLPVVVEIYPRLLTGPVNKGNPQQRREYLNAHHPDLEASILDAASASEDAFDALVSAIIMAQHSAALLSLPSPVDQQQRLEGEIWAPKLPATPDAKVRGLRDSSKTRVAPVFDALKAATASEPQWLRRLLDLVAGDTLRDRPWHAKDLSVLETHSANQKPPVAAIAYGDTEKGLYPPIALLSWLVRNLEPSKQPLNGTDETSLKRQKLAEKDPATIREALERLRTKGPARNWHILEGMTYPDVFIESRDALIVIEGKRTEAGATTHTTWMPARHQMLRHIDAAWEIRGNCDVYGFFIVEGGSSPEAWPPEKCIDVCSSTRSAEAIKGSLPHRSPEEQSQIASCFIGIATWQAVIDEFNLDPTILSSTRSPS